MTGKVELFYTYDHYGEDPARERHECVLIWYPRGHECKESESIHARAHSFAEAREKALATFKMLPPSEVLEVK